MNWFSLHGRHLLWSRKQQMFKTVGWKASKKDHKYPSVPWVLVCLYVYWRKSTFLSPVFTAGRAGRWFRRLSSTVEPLITNVVFVLFACFCDFRGRPCCGLQLHLKASELRLVEAVIWKKWCHKRWFEVTEQIGTLARALEPTRDLCPSYIILPKKYLSTWGLRATIPSDFGTNSRDTFQQGVKQQK